MYVIKLTVKTSQSERELTGKLRMNNYRIQVQTRKAIGDIGNWKYRWVSPKTYELTYDNPVENEEKTMKPTYTEENRKRIDQICGLKIALNNIKDETEKQLQSDDGDFRTIIQMCDDAIEAMENYDSDRVRS